MKVLKLVLILNICTILQANSMEKVELEKVHISSIGIEILIPKKFKIMSSEKMKAEYPGNPNLVYTNDEGNINIIFSKGKGGKIEQSQIPMMEMAMYNTKKDLLYPSSTWIFHGVKTINGRNFGIHEFISTTKGKKIYHLDFFSSFDNNLVNCTFTCPAKQMDEWKDIAHKIMSSISVNSKGINIKIE